MNQWDGLWQFLANMGEFLVFLFGALLALVIVIGLVLLSVWVLS